MLYHWLYSFSSEISFFNIFRYITFRSLVGFLFAVLFGVFIGWPIIKKIKMKQFGQIIRTDGPESHLKKAGTPTMGGLIIFLAFFTSLLVSANFSSIPVLATLFVFISYFVLGFFDDYLKVGRKNTKGISAKGKLVWQFSTAGLVSYLLLKYNVIDSNLYVPFLKEPLVDLGWFYIVFSSLVIVGSSNAVNLTDGLDGLATGPIITSSICLAILTYISGHKDIANYLFIPYIEGVGELTVFAFALVGACIGFLWYNTYPAQVFMGDTGSLSIGGALGAIAVLAKSEILFVMIGGIFVIEALSVIIQVTSYKLRKKRVFKMAPIHHHFELLGWPEPKVIVRFWIISALLGVMAIATLKIR
jgi:phospho-N-acetylmuramoyl-pentapeptide-transferase